MAYTYDALKAKTLAELRDIAKDLDAESVRGWSQMNKEHLLPAIAKALHELGLPDRLTLRKTRDGVVGRLAHGIVQGLRVRPALRVQPDPFRAARTESV